MDEEGGISVYEVTNDQERLETAVALCDASPAWPKDFDYVEFDATDLSEIGALPANPSSGNTNCGAVNRRHHDILLNVELRRKLIERIAQKLTGSSVSRIKRKDIEKAISNYGWLPANSRLRG